MKRGLVSYIAKTIDKDPTFISRIIRGIQPCPPKLAPSLEAFTYINRVIWVWGSPQELQQALDANWDEKAKCFRPVISKVHRHPLNEGQQKSHLLTSTSNIENRTQRELDPGEIKRAALEAKMQIDRTVENFLQNFVGEYNDG